MHSSATCDIIRDNYHENIVILCYKYVVMAFEVFVIVNQHCLNIE